jgi:FAD/FMN-containing dehydrogenase
MIGLLKKRAVDECLALNSTNLAAMLAEDWPRDFSDLKVNLPPWTLIVCIAGYQRRPEERIHIMQKYLMEIFGNLGLKPQSTLRGAEGRESTIPKLLSDVWEKEPYWKLRYRRFYHEIFFLTTLSQTSKFINLVEKIAARYSYPLQDIGCYVQPMVQGRGCYLEFGFPSDDTAAEKSTEFEMFMDASETLMKNGAHFNRPYGPWAEMAYSRYAEGVKVLKKLKGVFDPNNILNPGKLCF